MSKTRTPARVFKSYPHREVDRDMLARVFQCTAGARTVYVIADDEEEARRAAGALVEVVEYMPTTKFQLWAANVTKDLTDEERADVYRRWLAVARKRAAKTKKQPA